MMFFLFTSRDHVLNYVSKYMELHTGCRMDRRDMRQEVLLSYYTNWVMLPIEKDDPRIKGMFRDINRVVRHEYKHAAMIRYSPEESFPGLCEPQQVFEPPQWPDALSADEKKICQRIIDGESTYDIMVSEQITFAKYQKIKNSVKKKMMQNKNFHQL